jgi:hypothetical protein
MGQGAGNSGVAMTSAFRHSVPVAAAMLLAIGLAGCGTSGATTPAAVAQAPAPVAAEPPEPPLTRPEAAKQCWMATEKGRKDIGLDKRADIVTKCIDDKMKAAEAKPKS